MSRRTHAAKFRRSGTTAPRPLHYRSSSPDRNYPVISPARLRFSAMWMLATLMLTLVLNIAVPFTALAAAGWINSNPPPNGTFDLGATAVNTPISASLWVQNTDATNTLTFSNPIITSGAAEFSVTGYPPSIPPGQSRPFTFQCIPSSAGLRIGSVKFTTNDPAFASGVSWGLQCTGQNPAFSSTPAPGPVNVGSTSIGVPYATNVQVNNAPGAGTLVVSGYSLTGPNTGDFSITMPPLPFSVNAGGSQVMTFQCNPQPGPATTRLASIQLTTNDPANKNPVYNLSCTVVSPVFQATPAEPGPVNFTVNVGVGQTVPIYIFNNEPTTKSYMNVTSSLSDTTNFSINPSSLTGLNYDTGSVPMNVTCNPPTFPGTNPITATLTLTTNETPGGVTHLFNLVCTVNAVPRFGSTPALPGPLSMSGVAGSTQSVHVVIDNNAGDPGSTLVIGGFGYTSNYNVTNLSGSPSITKGNTFSFDVTCQPGVSPTTGQLNIFTNEPAPNNTRTFNLSCNLLAPVYNINPAPVTPTLHGPVGATPSQSYDITNTGTANLTGSISISGAGFTLNGGTASVPLSVSTAGGAKQTITIGCTVGSISKNGTLTVTTNEPTASPPQTYSYSLTCDPDFPVFNLQSPSPVTNPIPFTAQAGSSTTLNFVIGNSGPAGTTLNISQVTLFGANYSFNPIGSFSVAAGSTVTWGIKCSPPGAGPYTATLTFQTNNEAGGTQSHSYNLSCTGLVPRFKSSPTPNPAPAAAIALAASIGVPVSQNITVDNTTGDPGTSLNVTLQTNSNPGVFSVGGLPLSGLTQSGAGSSGAFTVSCTPSGASPAPTGTITVQTNEPGNPTYDFVFTCNTYTPQYSISPDPASTANTIDLGSTTVNLSPATVLSQNFTISNSGQPNSVLKVNASLTGSSDITLSGATFPLTLNQGANQGFTLKCSPTAAGQRTATLSFSTNEPGGSPKTYTYTVVCTGLIPNYTSNPAVGTINFGPVNVPPLNATDTKTVSITNPAPVRANDGGVLQVTGYNLSGPGAVKFSVSGPTAPFTIAPNGASQSLSITCTPGGGGTFNATLTVTSNDPTAGSAAYNLVCVGQAPGYSSNPAPNNVINAGQAAIGSPAPGGTLTITNTGTATLVVTAASPAISGPNAADFSLSGSLPASIGGGASTSLTVNCTPSVAGLRSATLTLNSNDPGVPQAQYTLNCTGLVPGYNSSPVAPGNPINVGSANIGQPVTFVLTIQNTGGADLTVNTPASGAISGPQAAEFALSGASFPLILKPNATQNVTITCTPAAGGLRTATLTFTSTDAKQPNPAYTLNCSGLGGTYGSTPAAPGGTITLNAIVGSTATYTLSIQNTGAGTLTVGLPNGGAITGANAAAFTMTGQTFPFSIPSGNPAKSVTISCTPTALGSQTATLTFTSSDPQQPTPTYTLVCNGRSAGFNSTPVAPGGSYSYGSAATGTALKFTLTLQNIGGGNITVDNPTFTGANPGDFSLSGAAFPLNLGASGSQDVLITCTPGLGQRSATLTFKTTDPAWPTATYSLSCQGLPAGYTSSPAAPGQPISFGITGENKEKLYTLTISNTGAGTLSVTLPPNPISGPDAAYFNIVNPNVLPMSLTVGGGSQDLVVRCYSAVKPGKFSATLTLNTTDPNWPTVTYALQCTVGKVQLLPADLYLSLKASPDRVVGNNSDNLIGYTFRVKNKGEGKAEYITLRLPIDSSLTVGYTQFDDKRIWVREVTDSEVVLNLPPLSLGEQVSGTVFFRPSQKDAPKPGAKITTRYQVEYIDPTAVWYKRYSNAVELTFAEAGQNQSAGNVTLLAPNSQRGKVGATMSYNAEFLAPEEFVNAWLTDKGGNSTKIDAGWADKDGKISFSFPTFGMQPGTYTISIMGGRSEAFGNAEMVLTDPELTPQQASMAVGAKLTLMADFLAAGETTTSWLTKPDGQTINITTTDGRSDAKGCYNVYLDSTGLAPGEYMVVVYGNATKLQAKAKLTITAPDNKSMQGGQTIPAQAAPKPAQPAPAVKAEQPAAPAPADTEEGPDHGAPPTQPAPAPSEAPAKGSLGGNLGLPPAPAQPDAPKNPPAPPLPTGVITSDQRPRR